MKKTTLLILLFLLSFSFSACAAEKGDPLYYQNKTIRATLLFSCGEGSLAGEFLLSPTGEARLIVQKPDALAGAVFSCSNALWQGELLGAEYTFSDGFLPGERLVSLFRLPAEKAEVRKNTVFTALEGEQVEITLENGMPTAIRSALWGGTSIQISELHLS